MTDLMQQAREQFEAWATSQHLPIKRHRWGEYKVDETEAAWDAWQAALRNDDCVREASNELAQLRRIESAARLACGLLWMVDDRSEKEHAAFVALRDAFGGPGSTGLKSSIEYAIAAGYEADHPQDADWWAGKKELDMRPNT